MIVIESAGLTDVGKKRKGNEDAFFLDDELKLYVVADGMGGHQAGEVASLLVVKTMEEYMKRFKSGKEVEELADSDKTLSKEANRLISGINLSNQVVFQSAMSSQSYRGMGSTVSAICFTEDTMIAANVGDSPIYLIRNNVIETISVPHTVMAEQMALHPGISNQFGKGLSHMLTRAMGIDESVKTDICEIQCFKDDTLVIASDGLSDKLLPEEIFELVNDNKKADKACQVLVDAANRRGGDDNITVIIIRIKAVNHKSGGLMGFISKLINMITR